jgi:membrane protease YdiL (CAAX protease family)
MHVRNTAAVATLCSLLGLLTVGLAIDAANPELNISALARVGFAAVAAVAIALFVRLLLVGLVLESHQMRVRNLFNAERVDRRDVLGLAVGPVWRGWVRRAVVVCADGRVIPAAWTFAGAGNVNWNNRISHLASGFGPTQEAVPEALAKAGRLDLERPWPNTLLPLTNADPLLSPATVSPVNSEEGRKWLGWETTFVVGAMVFPGLVAAIGILIQHFVASDNLNEFDLPIKHHPAASLIVLIISYFSTAVVVPIALLLLARTGQPPSSFGLSIRGFWRDAFGGVGLLGGVWVANIVIVLPLTLLFSSSFLNNGQDNSHVPAYYVIYGLLLSLTTAVNEEVIVNGYFMTRLAQLGYSSRAAFAISLVTRESYHIYYGIGFVATIPFGYLVTRSFQKRGKLTLPILAHFLFDSIAFTVAVLHS